MTGELGHLADTTEPSQPTARRRPPRRPARTRSRPRPCRLACGLLVRLLGLTSGSGSTQRRLPPGCHPGVPVEPRRAERSHRGDADDRAYAVAEQRGGRERMCAPARVTHHRKGTHAERIGDRRDVTGRGGDVAPRARRGTAVARPVVGHPPDAEASRGTEERPRRRTDVGRPVVPHDGERLDTGRVAGPRVPGVVDVQHVPVAEVDIALGHGIRRGVVCVVSGTGVAHRASAFRRRWSCSGMLVVRRDASR